MKFLLLGAGLLTCMSEFFLVSSESCEQMIDNFRLPDVGKEQKMKTWFRSQVRDGEPDCLDEIVDMMIKGMEGEEGGSEKRNAGNDLTGPESSKNHEKSFCCGLTFHFQYIEYWDTKGLKATSVKHVEQIAIEFGDDREKRTSNDQR